MVWTVSKSPVCMTQTPRKGDFGELKSKKIDGEHAPRPDPGAPLTYFNDGGFRQRFIFYTQKNPNFRICLPTKIPTFFSIPKKIPQCFCISKFYYLSSEITESATHLCMGSWSTLASLNMLLIFSRELLHTTKMGSQLTGPLSCCWNSTALTPGLSLVYKISFPCLYFYIATWSFDNRYMSAGKHLIHKMFTLYTVFPWWSWWLAWRPWITWPIGYFSLD